MIFFIIFLRFIAACLITNSHFTGVYPIEMIANGGLLGDVLFFAVSGYCLYNPKKTFPIWYGKRVVRCYLPAILITTVYLIAGFYSLSTHPFWWWFFWPTNYHFIASIILLYIPFYFFMRIRQLREKIPLIALLIAIAYIFVYLFSYDKTYYHIDTVREPMIEFLFIEAMLLGAWFRRNDRLFRNKFHWYVPVATFAVFVAYFVSKAMFSKIQSIAIFQPINQLLLLILLFFVFWTFSSLDSRLEKMPARIKKVVIFISEMTLEIYVVQYVLIDLIKQLGLTFPQIWIALIITIFTTAIILHFVCKGIYSFANKIFHKLKNKKV